MLSKHLILAAVLMASCGKDVPQSISSHASEAFVEIQRPDSPTFALAWGATPKPESLERTPWPFALESIGHSMASYQNYGGAPYFHHGLDIRGEAGNKVRTPVPGKVVNIENYVPGNALYWEVAILDEHGYLWQYHHVEKGSIPQQIHDAYQSGEPVAADTLIGEIVYWPVVTFGERYHHIHLNILGQDKVYLNPFSFLEALPDNQAPKVESLQVAQGGITVETVKAGMPYDLHAHVTDLIMHDKFILPPYAIKVQIDNQPMSTVWQFDTLPGGADKEKDIHSLYSAKETCGDYRCRKPVINLGFNNTNRSFPSAAGDYEVMVLVEDYGGLSSSKAMTLRIR